MALAAEGSAASGGPAHRPGGEVNIQLPDLTTDQALFLGFTGHDILLSGLVVCVLGLLFGLLTYTAVKKLPVHQSMADVSALIYETCKAYLIQQGKLLLVLECFIGVVIVYYFWLTGLEFSKILVDPAVLADRHRRQLRRRVVRHPDQHARQLAHGLRQPARQGVPLLRDPAARRHERRHDADLGRAAVHARHPALHPELGRRRLLPRLRHRRVARRRGAAHRGRHLHQDRRHRLRPDEGRLQDQGRRRAQPGRHRRLHGRQRGRLGGPDGRRLRDLRRHRRRADHLHRAGRGRPADPGAAAGLDLHDARDDGRRLGRLVTSSATTSSPRRATATPTR